MSARDKPVVRCRHCGNVIVRQSSTSTGWTHGDAHGRDIGLWVGVRCPGRLTGAEPQPCAECEGPIADSHGPYVNDDGARICAICELKRDPVLSEAMTRALRRLTGRA